MHIEISEYSPLFEPFDSKRKQEGFTTFKAAILEAMKLYIVHDSLKIKQSCSDCSICEKRTECGMFSKEAVMPENEDKSCKTCDRIACSLPKGANILNCSAHRKNL